MVTAWLGDAKYHRPVKSGTVYKECRDALNNNCDGVQIIAPEYSNCAYNAVDKAMEKYGVTVILTVD